VFTDIKKLQIFVTIVEEGSFTRAAERLRVAQPWISVQLRQLEDMMDAVLLERSKGKLLKLSEAGEQLLPIARKLLAHCAVADDEIRSLRDRRRKLLLGVDLITLYIPERNNLIREFVSRNSDIDLEVVSLTPKQLFDGLNSGQLDLILAPCPFPDEDVEILPLYEHEICLAIPHAVSEKYRGVEERGLTGVKLLCLPQSYNPTMARWLRSSLETAGVEWVVCPEMSYLGLIRYASTLGIATLSPDLSSSLPEIDRELEFRSLRKHGSLSVRWGLMRRPGHHEKALERLWRMAARSARQFSAQSTSVSPPRSFESIT
jgi:DNA-binding transcriptional LysR family regulator